MIHSNYQIQVWVFVGFSQELADHYVHSRRTADPHSRHVAFVQFVSQNVLKRAAREAQIVPLTNPFLRILPEFHSQLYSSLFGQVHQLVKSDRMHVFNVLKGSQHLKGEVFEGIRLEDGAQGNDLSSKFRLFKH